MESGRYPYDIKKEKRVYMENVKEFGHLLPGKRMEL
jgi:hypothetical protein